MVDSILTPESKRKLDRVFMRMRGESSDIARTEAHGVVRGTGGGVNAATLAGDVTGRLVATVVERIRGLLVSAAAPNVGDTLRWNGSQWAPAAVAGSGPLTTYTNWALAAAGASATASSEYSAIQAAAYAIDGDDGSWWASAFGTNVANEWLRVDLGAIRTIDYFRAFQYWPTDFGAATSKIQSSPDGTTWTDRHSLGAFTDSGVVALASGPISARYWRFYGLSGPVGAGSYWRLNSLELLQSATTPAVTAGHVIQDEGTPRTQRAALDFVGDDVAVTDGPGDKSTVTVTGAIRKSLIDAKGDLIVGTADNTLARLPVGTNGQMPYADSAQTTGIRWDDAPSSVDPTSPTTYAWVPITNGDPDYPELIFNLDGDVIVAWAEI